MSDLGQPIAPADAREISATELAAWREQLLVATGRAAECLLNGTLDAAAFQVALGILGEAARVSRVYVFSTTPDATGTILCSQTYEWCAAGVPPQIDNPDLQNLPLRELGFGRWLDVLERDEPLYGTVRDFPEAERAMLDPQGILSLAVMPVRLHDRLWGFIGFDDCENAQKWTSDTIGCLHVAARVLSAALERLHYKRRSESLEVEFQELVESIDSILFRMTSDGRWGYLSPAWQTQLGWSVAESVGRPAVRFVHPADRGIVLEAWRQASRAVPSAYRNEVRFLRRDGTFCWMLVNIKPQAGARTRAMPTVGTLADITVSKRNEAELIAARKAAESANMAKNEFLSTMSHELRTPLNAVIGLSESLLEMGAGLDAERTRHYLRIIHSSGQQLLVQINDVLDLARIEAGRIQLNPAAFDLFALVGGTVDGTQREARAKSLLLTMQRPSEPLVVNADERLLRQILQNLLSNAIKFTPAKGSIEVSVVRRVDGGVSLRVKDTGIGIPEEKRHLLFKPFTQVDASLGRRFGGTGLGLSLVDRLARLHGATVSVESKVGVGSTFSVDLPASIVPPAVSGTAQRGSQILLVDDDAMQHTLVGDYLKRKGVGVIHCYDGESALNAMRHTVPQIAIVDINMPRMNGLELIRQLRSQPAGAHLPILALTALTEAGDAANCREAGATEFLPKPVSLAGLSTFVRRYAGVTV